MRRTAGLSTGMLPSDSNYSFILTRSEDTRRPPVAQFGLCIPLDSLRRTATAEACFAVADGMDRKPGSRASHGA